MSARDVIYRHIGDYLDGDDTADATDDVMTALAAAGFVVVACPPGSRVVVSRESKPCPEVYRSDLIHGDECERCGGHADVARFVANAIDGAEFLEQTVESVTADIRSDDRARILLDLFDREFWILSVDKVVAS